MCIETPEGGQIGKQKSTEGERAETGAIDAAPNLLWVSGEGRNQIATAYSTAMRSREVE